MGPAAPTTPTIDAALAQAACATLIESAIRSSEDWNVRRRTNATIAAVVAPPSTYAVLRPGSTLAAAASAPIAEPIASARVHASASVRIRAISKRTSLDRAADLSDVPQHAVPELITPTPFADLVPTAGPIARYDRDLHRAARG